MSAASRKRQREAIDLHRAGKSNRQIADLLKVHESTVSGYLRDYRQNRGSLPSCPQIEERQSPESTVSPPGGKIRLEWEYSLKADAHTARIGNDEYTISADVGFRGGVYRAYVNHESLGTHRTLGSAKQGQQTYAQAVSAHGRERTENAVVRLKGVIESYRHHEPYRNEPPASYRDAQYAEAELRDRYGFGDLL